MTYSSIVEFTLQGKINRKNQIDDEKREKHDDEFGSELVSKDDREIMKRVLMMKPKTYDV